MYAMPTGGSPEMQRLFATGFAQLPFRLHTAELKEFEALPIGVWRLSTGPGATYLPTNKWLDRPLGTLERRVLRVVRLAARYLADLGGLPPEIAHGDAWHSSMGSYGVATSARLLAHQDLEVLTAIVAIGEGLQVAPMAASGGEATWIAAPACDGAMLTLLTGRLAQDWSQGAIPACWHRVGHGPLRRAFLLFYVGDARLCRWHGRPRCDCGDLSASLRERHQDWWALRNDGLLDPA